MPDGEVTLSATGQADLTLPIATGYAPHDIPRQSSSVSGGGVFRTTELAPDTLEITLTLQNITRTEYTALRAFLIGIRWGATAVSITDPFGVHPRMHYAGGWGSGRWRRGDEYSVALTFRQSAADSLGTVVV